MLSLKVPINPFKKKGHPRYIHGSHSMFDSGAKLPGIAEGHTDVRVLFLLRALSTRYPATLLQDIFSVGIRSENGGYR